MLIKNISFAVILTLTSQLIAAQNKYIDSLKLKLQQNVTSTESIKILEVLTEKYRSEEQYADATKTAQQLLKLAKKEKNTQEIAKAYTFLGIIANNTEQYGKTSLYIDSATAVSSKSKGIATAYSEYLQAYQENSFQEYKKAMEHTLKAKSSLESADKDYNLEFKINYMLYVIYSQWNDLKNTLKYAEATVKSAELSGNKNHLSNAYSALAVAYTYKFGKTESEKDRDFILNYAKKAASLFDEYPGQVANYTYAIARNNIASYLLGYYPKLTPELKKEIEENVHKSLEISKLTSNSQSTQAGSLGMLSYIAKESGDLQASEQYLKQAYDILLTQKPIYYYMMIQIVSDMSALYKQKGDLGKALEYQEKVTEYSNQLFNENQAAAVKKLEAQYQSEKKEKEVQQQKQLKLLYAGLGIIAIVGGFFMFRSYHFRLKYSLEREKQLALETNEAQLQVQLEKEEKARLKAEQEVLTLQQGRLQNEVLANQLHLQHKNDILHQLKEKLDDNHDFNIKQIIREENLVDKDFEKAKFEIQEVHPNFFKNLNEKAVQKLTDLDLKYCSYMLLGMNSKQISNLLNVEPKSVNMTKYRLKKKFNLDAETDLVQFIKGII